MDSSPTLRFERLPLLGRLYTKNANRFPDNVEYGDILAGLPIPDDSCGFVYCSHVLEHLSLEEFRIALKNTFKILRPGGTFRFVLPDLEFSVKKYLASDEDTASISFLQETLLGREKRQRGFAGLVKVWLGNSEHLWMWDFKSIRLELEMAGFENVRRASLGDSNEEMFSLVEESQRWRSALGVNCTRPEEVRN